MKIVRMAFNLYCNGTPSVLDIEDVELKLKECQAYTAEEIFCCCYAQYFWEAVKIRYPHECNYIGLEDAYAEEQTAENNQEVRRYQGCLTES